MIKMIRAVVFALLCLTVVSSTAVAQKPKVLLFYADVIGSAQDVKSKLDATGLFAQVDLRDMNTTTPPSIDFLMQYDAVMSWTNYTALSGVGNLLAQYVDNGKGVVIAMFGHYATTYTIKENFGVDKYQVIVPSTGYTTASSTLGSVLLPSHPLMKNVSTFSASTAFRSTSTSLAAGAYRVANWASGEPLIAAKENVSTKKARRVDLNFFPPSSTYSSSYWLASTHGGQIMANALLWVAGGGAPPAHMTVSPKTVDFGTRGQNETAQMTVTVGSLGPGTLKFDQVFVSGPPDFTIVSAPKKDDTLQASRTVNIVLNFKPMDMGTRVATLTIMSNGVDSGTQQIVLKGVGSFPGIEMADNAQLRKVNISLGKTYTHCMPLTSIGVAPLRIDSVVFSGDNADEYMLISKPSALLPGESGNICIGFAPNFEGRSDARVSVYSNAFNKPLITIPLFGNGILRRLTIDPPVLDFDSVVMGEEVCRELTLHNPGTDTLHILKNYVSYADPDFRITPLSDTTLAPLESVKLQVCFNAKKRGIRVARYEFHTDIPKTFELVARDTGKFVIDVFATAVPIGSLAFKDDIIDSSMIGVEHCKTYTVTNASSVALQLTSAEFTGAGAQDYVITAASFPMTVDAGATTSFNICFTPSTRGEVNSELVFTGTSAGNPTTITYPVMGTGLLACATPSVTAMFDEMMTNVGANQTSDVTVTNCGDVAATYTATFSSGLTGYSIVGSATSDMIAPGATATFSVRHEPTEIGLNNGSLEITGGPSMMSISLNGVGAGVLGASSNTDAGNVAEGDCRSYDVTIANNGNVDWTPGDGVIAGTNGNEFTIETALTPATIAAGQSGVVTIKFCPTAIGSRTATLSFPGQSPAALNSVFPIALSGTSIQSGVTGSVRTDSFALMQSSPNPFVNSTTITFSVPSTSDIRLDLMDQKGAVVKSVASGKYAAGEYPVSVDAEGLASGTYFFVLSANGVQLTQQVVLTK